MRRREERRRGPAQAIAALGLFARALFAPCTAESASAPHGPLSAAAPQHAPSTSAPASVAAPPSAAATVTLHGILEIAWGDPHPGHPAGGEVRHTLAMPDGRRVDLELPGHEAGALLLFGRRVVVAGRATGALASGAASGGSLLVESLAADEAADEAAEERAGAHGPGPSPLFVTVSSKASAATAATTRRVIFLLLRFADDAGVPNPPSFFEDLTNPVAPPEGSPIPATINGFFTKTSAGAFAWNADVGGEGGVPATDWITLPHPKSHYAPCGWGQVCANLGAIIEDGMGAGEAEGIDFTLYDNVNFVLSNDLDCCAWGGGLAWKDRFYGATWEPPWGQNTSTYAHEMGHSIGLPHSGWVYHAYDSPWDVMSSITSAPDTFVECGSYLSANSGVDSIVHCSEPGDGYISAHKEILGWIPEEELVVLGAEARATVLLEGASLPTGDATKMVKVCLPCEPCEGAGAHYLTIEARVGGLGALTAYDNGIPGDGVLLHDVRLDRAPISGACYFNSQSGWATPLDATPDDWDGPPTCGPGLRQWPEYALFNAQLVPGERYTHAESGLVVEVRARDGEVFEVLLNPCDDPEGCAPVSVAGCICGNASVDAGEECDDGDDLFVAGEWCRADCRRVPCGCPTGSESPTAADALFTLRAAVGLSKCDLRVCDADRGGQVGAADALRVLRVAVGLVEFLACPEE